jgi:hypothetical protein
VMVSKCAASRLHFEILAVMFRYCVLPWVTRSSTLVLSTSEKAVMMRAHVSAVRSDVYFDAM